MANFNYMTDIVEFGFADSFRKGLSGIAKKGKSLINDVRGTNPGSKTINIKPTSSTIVQPKKATAYGAPGDYNLTNTTKSIPGSYKPTPKPASSYKRPSLDRPVGYQNLTNTTKVTPGGAGSYATKKKWYES